MNKEYPYVDYFRLVAAFLIVAIHMGPFAAISESMDYYIVYCLGRIAVPFFIAVTGYFSFYKEDTPKMLKTIWKLLILYIVATIIYLPINFYAGNLPSSFGEALRWFFFDGTFYHLWYLPGVIIGGLLVIGLQKVFSDRLVLVISSVLYVFGLLGDSYYGLTAQIPALKACYDGIFLISTYTRNGIFLTPIFLILGIFLHKYAKGMDSRKSMIGMIICLVLLLIEGGLTRHLAWQRHNSMYVMLPFVMFFLMALLFSREASKTGNRFKRIRDISLWIYLLHPLCLVIVRGGAGAIGIKEWLVENPFICYLTVCVSSLVLGIIMVWGSSIIRGRKDGTSRE